MRVQIGAATVETGMKITQKKLELPYDPAMLLLGTQTTL